MLKNERASFIMALQQALVSPLPEPAEARLAVALEELDRERKAVGEIQRSLNPPRLLRGGSVLALDVAGEFHWESTRRQLTRICSAPSDWIK